MVFDLQSGHIINGLSLSDITNGDLFVCVEVLRPSQPYGVMSSMINEGR